MTEPNSNADNLEHTDVLCQTDFIGENRPGEIAGAHASSSVFQHQYSSKSSGRGGDDTSSELTSSIARLERELESTKALLNEREQTLRQEQRRVQTLQEELQQLTSSNAPNATNAGSNNLQNSFDIMLTLSSEREAALRERKRFKDRAADAEANVAQLESDLAAAHANAKLQVERANKFATRCEELQRLLRDRDKRIAELELQLTDRAGTPTMFEGELERLAAGAFPTAIYALESLDIPGEVHRLTRPTNTVGRSKDNDIPLESPSVSRFHARLQNKPDGVWLADLQSSNGCQVNGRRVSGQILKDGDLVTIGTCRFRFSTVAPN